MAAKQGWLDDYRGALRSIDGTVERRVRAPYGPLGCEPVIPVRELSGFEGRIESARHLARLGGVVRGDVGCHDGRHDAARTCACARALSPVASRSGNDLFLLAAFDCWRSLFSSVGALGSDCVSLRCFRGKGRDVVGSDFPMDADCRGHGFDVRRSSPAYALEGAPTLSMPADVRIGSRYAQGVALWHPPWRELRPVLFRPDANSARLGSHESECNGP